MQHNKRKLLPYFLESKLWKEFESSIVDNYTYWVKEDPSRAARMLAASQFHKKGYTIGEYIYDMLDCVYDSKLKPRTKTRLYKELDDLELYHSEFNTLENEL